MAEKTLSIKGVPYLYINEAAKTAGLVPDYIARLCRRGEIKGTKVDRVWYVSEQSLKDFLVTHTYERRLWRENLSQARRKEYAHHLTRPPQRMSAITTIAPPELWPTRLVARVEQRLAREAHAAAHMLGGGASYAVSPSFELLQKLTALAGAVVLVIGAYALVNPGLRASAPLALPQAAAAGAVLEQALRDLQHDLRWLFFRNPARVDVSVEREPRP